MCEQCHKLMTHMSTILADLEKNVAASNRLLQDIQRARIPKFLANARLYEANGTSVNMAYHTQAQVLIRVTMMIIVVGSPATLVIGDRTWPINGFTTLYLGDEGLLIRPEDQVILTQNVAGLIGLEFFGEEMVDRGKRW